MDETTNTVANEEQKNINTPDNDDLKDAITKQLEKVQLQNLLLGAQSMCKVILEKIYVAKKKPGKFSYRDYERLVDGIEEFCIQGLAKTVNHDGTTSDKTEEEEVE